MKHAAGLLMALSLFSLSTTVACAADGEVVMGTWGGGNSEMWREKVGKPFSASSGIVVKIRDWSDPEPTLRAQARKPQFNVALGTCYNAANLQKDGLLESFKKEDFPELANFEKSSYLIDQNGEVYAFGIYFQYYGAAFNSDQAKASDFESWRALADPKFKDKVAIARPIYAAPNDLVLFAKVGGGDENNIQPGIPLLTSIARNALTVTNSTAQMNALLSRGEVTAGAYYSSRVWTMRASGVKNVDITIPSEGGLLLSYFLIVPKGAKNLDAVKAWINYALRPAPELAMLDASGFLPLNQTAALSQEQLKEVGSPQSLRSKLYQPDCSVLAANQEKRVNLVEQIYSQVK
ncbi:MULTISPECIES: extracellular solute-binding protein [Bradyrhizobium]|uniref:Extracellular solute-binding protein n=2 Tax=Bradyrhizobium TaxID=374 RepID=A0A9X1RCD1_9BRAD|nr:MULTISPECIES: extracellular solute-binding protein [Bradyrhizobium]MCG2629336.1 extracellular solute-binding protein [Bradyrhizobium zhengyangense]MCG2644617.1 extracellular solute-binding protein [Bradyrhizobium zhengyangense]MCG2670850.1 extracellular solute-binding protein [Bradyrhizobium zhengyangense]MDN4984483.1 extracellular solute-binding protein [Bradyrhizobium sp. WYCCWR 13022]MDN5002475.1 extracellular solute-binding protein [Bradyrhizobium sp. WYCCWR 12677]